jgi:hypothetical protein
MVKNNSYVDFIRYCWDWDRDLIFPNLFLAFFSLAFFLMVLMLGWGGVKYQEKEVAMLKKEGVVLKEKQKELIDLKNKRYKNTQVIAMMQTKHFLNKSEELERFLLWKKIASYIENPARDEFEWVSVRKVTLPQMEMVGQIYSSELSIDGYFKDINQFSLFEDQVNYLSRVIVENECMAEKETAHSSQSEWRIKCILGLFWVEG